MMARPQKRPHSPELNGWLIIDKPTGLTSSNVVVKVRRTLGIKKVGHAGTLDPLATGILPLAIGEATKTVSYLMSSIKDYTFTVKWGQQTNTEDSEGETIETSSHRPSKSEIQQILPSFVGKINQIPPIFSAIKIQGQRAYKRARNNEHVEMPAREVQIDDLTLISMPDDDHAIFKVTCHKGTYVRSIARDIALILGTVGHITALRRTRVGSFSENESISLEKFCELGHNSVAEGFIHPIEVALDDIPAISLQDQQSIELCHGKAVEIQDSLVKPHPKGPVFCKDPKGKLIALATIEAGYIRPKRVFNL